VPHIPLGISPKIPTDSITWILGDFHLPYIDWDKETITNACTFKIMYKDFLENIVNSNLSQVVKNPTRERIF